MLERHKLPDIGDFVNLGEQTYRIVAVLDDWIIVEHDWRAGERYTLCRSHLRVCADGEDWWWE